MMTQQHTTISIKVTHNGSSFETKTLKYHYNKEVLYKIALPSAVSPVQQCWISKDNQNQWRVVMGMDTDQLLVQELTAAIKKQEQIIAMMPKVDLKPALKSA